jgi:hypothetical protein
MNGPDGKDELRIEGYNNWKRWSRGEPIEEFDTKYTAVILEDGLLSLEDAKVFGVPIYVTRRLATASINELVSYSLNNQARLRGVEASPPIALQEAIQAQLIEIRKAYPHLRWYQLGEGGYFFYHSSETLEEFVAESNRLRGVADVISLPAIYDITLEGMRVIRCPFIGFINPRTILQWNSRYTLNTMVGYFYRPRDEKSHYMALLINVEFDTDGDSNMMEITCVDVPEPHQAIEEPPPMDTHTNPDVIKQRYRWPPYNTSAGRRAGSLSRIIEHILRPSAQENIAAWGGTLPSIERMAQDFRSWNPEFFTDAFIRRRTIGPETDTYFRRAGVDFRVPIFWAGDPYWLYTPYLPSYEGLNVQTIEEPRDP